MDVNTTGRKAMVLGGTGLIGNELVHQLMINNMYTEVRILGRRNIAPNDPKIRFYEVDMEHLNNYRNLFDIDDVFCCLGTTIKKAGSKPAFKKVDFEMVVNAAKLAEGKAQQFFMISSLGANKNSGNFYLRTKGETEAIIFETSIPSITVLRPSILFGDRKENRIGEKIGIAIMKGLGPLMVGGLKKYRGNEANAVAKAMIIYASLNKPGKHIYESLEIEEVVNSTSKK